MGNIAQGSGRDTAECYISLETMPKCYISVVHERKPHFNWFIVCMISRIQVLQWKRRW